MTELEKNTITELIKKKPFIRKYWNGAMSFDIETSSFYYKGEKAACMYLWAFAIDDYAITGRTWKEFIELVDFLDDMADDEHKFVIYVHNLSYEFQWICKKFHWAYVFALSKREVATAARSRIVFKCSLLLSGLSLESTANKYNKVHKKAIELADYESIRTPESELEESDYEYVKQDVLCVTEYINTMIERYECILDIPMTSTGAVRKELRKHLFPDGKRHNAYGRLMKKLTVEPEEYKMLRKAYMGGFTHANWHYAGRTVRDVVSMDFTSSYPAVMLLDYLPMSKGIKVKFDRKYLDDPVFCCIVSFKVKNVSEKILHEHFLSFNKVEIDLQKLKDKKIKCDVDNGRIINCDEFSTTMTEIDFKLFEECYDYEEIEFGDCYIYKKGYLPKPFMEYILFLYKQKTTLKDVEGQEVYYNLYKAFLNSLYGMLVTDDIGRPDVKYRNFKGWSDPERPDIEARTDKYNGSKNRFAFYPWGVYVTSHAREHLWQAIKALGDDYLYSDTDSVKVKNFEEHRQFFEDYNKNIEKKIRHICKLRGFKKSDFEPETIKGEKKMIGVFDQDGTYSRFKDLGSKRYLYEYAEGSHKGEIVCTISGLPKKAVKNFGEDPFTFFSNHMYLNEDESLKSIVTYSDKGCKGRIKDKNGKLCHFEEDSFVHIEKTTFMLGLSPIYEALIGGNFRIGATG